MSQMGKADSRLMAPLHRILSITAITEPSRSSVFGKDLFLPIASNRPRPLVSRIVCSGVLPGTGGSKELSRPSLVYPSRSSQVQDSVWPIPPFLEGPETFV